MLNAAHVRQEWREKKRKFESGEDTGERQGKHKRRRADGTPDVKGKTKGLPDAKAKNKMLGIQPGESLGHFNRCALSSHHFLALESSHNCHFFRRVEDDMRPLVKSAMQSSSAQARKVKKSELDSKSKGAASAANDQPLSPPQDATSKHDGRPTEFQKTSTSAPRRLNDIAQAPPEFKKPPRGINLKDGANTVKSTSGNDGVLSMKQKLMMEEERENAIVRYRALKERRKMEGAGGGERYNGGDDE